MKINAWFNDRLVPAPAVVRVGSGTPAPAPRERHWLRSQGSEGSDDEERTVRARRRRRTEPPGPAGRERAEAPRRRRADDAAQAAPPPRRTARPSTRPISTGGLPLGSMSRSQLVIIAALALVAVCVFAAMLLLGGPGDEGEGLYTPPTSPPGVAQPAVRPSATTAPQPFVPPAVSSEGQTWLVMLYQDADDQILEQDIYLDMNEAERVGSSERVQIVAQVDRYRAGYTGDGNWSSTRRFYVTRDDDLQRVRSQVVADVGEANMSDGETLVDFVTWAIETLPADKHVLILSDHGMGWPGGWSDPEPGGQGDRSIPLASALGDQLYLMELDQALEEIRARTGVERFELIGMDACLMGHLEVMSALAPHARYAVASQETEPALGWAYTGFLQALANNPDMDGAELGRQIVANYIQSDQRIVDDQARAEFLRQGSPMGGLFGMLGATSAEQLARQMEQNITLTAIDLSALPSLLDSVNALAYTLQRTNQRAVAQARTYAQSFTSVFGRNAPPSYIDLGNFVQLLQRESRDPAVAQAADGVLTALGQAVVAERHGPNKPGATGLSIYFPNSQLYGTPVTGPESYTAIARRFADVSVWDDFLAFHYTGRPFEPAARAVVVPEAGTAITAPGAGPIEISPIRLSGPEAAPGQPVLLSADIRGEEIGYIYLFAGFYDPDANSIFVADMDYLESEDTREIDGVYYPDWGEGAFTLEFEWEPLLFAIDDGVDSVIALFTPERYGAAPEEAIYSVEGIFTYASDAESRHARLLFQDGVLRQVFGFTGQDGTGAPREIIPAPGDQFTVLEKWMDLDAGGRVAQVVRQEGGSLVFGNQMFRWQELDAAPGEYMVGFLVEDLDGNRVEAYAAIRVAE